MNFETGEIIDFPIDKICTYFLKIGDTTFDSSTRLEEGWRCDNRSTKLQIPSLEGLYSGTYTTSNFYITIKQSEDESTEYTYSVTSDNLKLMHTDEDGITYTFIFKRMK